MPSSPSTRSRDSSNALNEARSSPPAASTVARHGGRGAHDDAVLDDRVGGAARADADVDVLVALRPAALIGDPVACGVDIGGRGDVRAVAGGPDEGEGADAISDPGLDVALAALPTEQLLQPPDGVGGAEHLPGRGQRVVTRRARRRDRRLHVHGRACGDDGCRIRGRLLLRAAAGDDRDEEGSEHREAQTSGRCGGGHVPRRYRGVRALRAMHTDRRNRPRGCKTSCVRAWCTETPGFSGSRAPTASHLRKPCKCNGECAVDGSSGMHGGGSGALRVAEWGKVGYCRSCEPGWRGSSHLSRPAHLL